MDSLDAFFMQQRLRIVEKLEDTPKIPQYRPGTEAAVDPDDLMIQKAYTRRETVGHPTPAGRMDRRHGY